MRKKKTDTETAAPKPAATCLNVVNPLGGFSANHSPLCAYDHRDGEIVFNPPADVHIQLGVTAARPNGLCCANVCFYHAEYGSDRDGGKAVKHAEGTFVVSDAPIIDSRALLTEPRTQAIRKAAKPPTAEPSDSDTDTPAAEPKSRPAAPQADGSLLDKVNAHTKDNPLLRGELSAKERKLARDLAAAGVICRDETAGRISYYPKFA